MSVELISIDLPPVIGPLFMLVHKPLQPGGAERNPAVTARSPVPFDLPGSDPTKNQVLAALRLFFDVLGPAMPWF